MSSVLEIMTTHPINVAVIERAVEVLRGGGLEAGAIARVAPTLEDVFVGLIEAEDRRRAA